MNRVGILAISSLLGSCASTGGTSPDADTDVDTDSDTDGDTDTGGDTDSDSDTGSASDTASDTGTGSDPSVCPDECVPDPNPPDPECSEIGAACRDNRDCPLGYFCVPDASDYPGGYCLAGGPVDAGACDPDLPATCPAGSTCTYGGSDEAGVESYYCFKSCNIGEETPCGCRAGYTCVFTEVDCRICGEPDGGRGICVPDCTNYVSPDGFCRDHWGDAPSCNDATGECGP